MKIKHTISLLLIALSVACSCGASSANAIKGHSYAAETLDEFAQEARDTVMEMRKVDIVQAVTKAEAAGQDPRPAAELAAAQFDARPLIPAVNSFISAKEVYVRSVLLAAQADKPDFAAARLILRDALNSYRSLKEALGDRGDRLPDIPPIVFDLVGGGR